MSRTGAEVSAAVDNRPDEGKMHWSRALLAAWAVAALIYSTGLMLTGVMGNLGCERPAGSSQYGRLEMTSFPLGFECRYDNLGQLDVEGPGVMTDVVQVGLVLMPAALWWAAGRVEGTARRRRRREILITMSAVTIACGVGFALAANVSYETPPLLRPLALAAGVTGIVSVVALLLTARDRTPVGVHAD